MRSLRFRPHTQQRLRTQIRRNAPPYFCALAVWAAWAATSLVLTRLFGEQGQFYAMLFLGALLFIGLVYVALWLQSSQRRERRWEAQHQQEIAWKLNDLVRPRRPLPLWDNYMAKPETLECLWRLIQDRRPNHILELGCGLSTLVMAYALEAAGRGQLVSLEDHAGFAARTRRLLEKHGLDAYATVIETPLRGYTIESEVHYWYRLDELRADCQFDHVLVDGPAGYLHPKIRNPALPVLRHRLSEDAVIVVDDTDRAQQRDMVRQWLADYPELRVDDRFANPHFTVLQFSRQHADVGSGEAKTAGGLQPA